MSFLGPEFLKHLIPKRRLPNLLLVFPGEDFQFFLCGGVAGKDRVQAIFSHPRGRQGVARLAGRLSFAAFGHGEPLKES